MPQQHNPNSPLLRIAVLIVMMLVAVGIVWSVSRNSSRQQQQIAGTNSSTPTSPATAPPATAPAEGHAQDSANRTAATDGPAAGQPKQDASVEQAHPATQPAAAPTPAPVAPAVQQPANAAPGAYRAKVFTTDPLAQSFAPLGSLDPKLARGQITFSPIGAGIRDYRLSEHYLDWRRTTHYTVQSEHSIQQARQPDGSITSATLTPMAALGIWVNGSFVVLATDPAGPTWRQVAADRPGIFEALVEDAAGVPILRIERAYSITPANHDVSVRQTIANLTDAPVRIRWLQLAPVDPPQDADGYGSDRRRMPFGYVLPSTVDPNRLLVSATDYAANLRANALGPQGGFGYATDMPLWPDVNAIQKQYELSWSGMTNRYFGIAAHPLIDPAASTPRLFSWVSKVDRVLVNPAMPDGMTDEPVLAIRLDSRELTIAPKAGADVSMGLWMGPLSHKATDSDPLAKALGLGGMIIANMGGPCMYCTFDIITYILRTVMYFLHDYVFRDWSLAIIFLVVFVRTCLHPLTRWSQIRMQRFGKQMSLMQPKQKKIQERYKDDPKKMQAEMAGLWREEGISPFGMLGCLPMLLVTPVWLSLYALLYYEVEFRNAPAFYGVIQSITGNSWGFLADLSHPDALISFGATSRIPVLSAMIGPISSLNILPLLLGLVFFFHQKYLTPPTSTPLTPEQEMQQKMIKIMSVLMFPIFMYNAPAGLALYFTTNSTLAIVENAWIRKHMNKHGLLDEDKLKRKPRDPNQKGFMQKLMEAAEAKRKAGEAQARRDQLDRGRGKK
ncbi:MAG: YidC/Oxa1 family insertase periplasmic-domain containing protein [Phycisphaerales bacterium]|nr:YidC/Oxa1 family insertase periplasmic-domain containing protein [Phycisphaerales bacterium]